MPILQSINVIHITTFLPTLCVLVIFIYILDQLYLFIFGLVFLNDKNNQTKTINMISTSEPTGSGETPDDNEETPIEKLKRKAKQDSDDFVFVLQLIAGVAFSICVFVFLKNAFGGDFPATGGTTASSVIDTFPSKSPVAEQTMSKIVTETIVSAETGDCCKAAVETAVEAVVEAVKESTPT